MLARSPPGTWPPASQADPVDFFAQPGRPSKALSTAQAEAILTAAESSLLHAYIDVSLLTGARTEELRALTWDHVDLDGAPGANPPVRRTSPRLPQGHQERRRGRRAAMDAARTTS